MDSDLSHQLKQDIYQHITTLNGVLSRLQEELPTSAVLETGLFAANTLKSLAAVKGIAHTQVYAAQMEQLFLQAQQIAPESFHREMLPRFKAVQQEFRQACSQLESQADAPPANNANMSAKLNRLTNQLRQLESHQHRKPATQLAQHLQYSEVPLESVFRSFVPWLNQAARASQKLLQVQLEVPRPVNIHAATTGPLHTILVHLLRNALFHGIESPQIREEQGKPRTATIRLSGSVEAGELVLLVYDDGQGFDDAGDMESGTFKHFFRNEAISGASASASCPESTAVETSIYALANTQTGLGVGLHIVRTQVAQLDGTFTLDSQPGTGTTAMVRIPLAMFRDQGE